MIAAAAMTPTSTVLPSGAPTDCLEKPIGMKGSKLAGLNTPNAMMMNISSASSLMTTRIALTVALSLVPKISMPATSAMISTAGILAMPPSSGPLAKAIGIPNKGEA